MMSDKFIRHPKETPPAVENDGSGSGAISNPSCCTRRASSEISSLMTTSPSKLRASACRS
ncbi:hypothetical protein ABB37_08882 [Leptomonas pyrrhocoris]|uniref:Uncharacterized protein n=1 Tax=Leptomonas pyrrhocoris TaxID=157538 RepID=A0A0N0VD77_LEPPY|nr:hypothetical protein ABB37_08882 [Leptomonas pyrrhocoris]KPA74874.1 hypothetical protein ABB37_08882 [Leptomonas pyrrhocoris]|eukprot:XP_015653313.1 hypothetical protein ABB37_08882 [Leptomonas pyrrhocoris]